MQVFYTCLPNVFDQSEDFIDSIGYLPLNNNQCRIEIKNKHYILIQEAKRAPPQDTCMFLSSSFD